MRGRRRKDRNIILLRLLPCLGLLLFFQSTAMACMQCRPEQRIRDSVNFLASLGDRSTGTPGNHQAAQYIRRQLAATRPAKLGRLEFLVPVLRHRASTLTIGDRSIPLTPIFYNAITPENLPAGGLSGPLIYVGRGEPEDFDGRQVAGAIVLMEFDSGRNWLNAASLGAAALIYINRGTSPADQFRDKEELSPIQFPCFWIEAGHLAGLIPDPARDPDGLAGARATITSHITWEAAQAENIYALYPGTNQKLENQLIVVEAFYDSTVFIPGRSPGADEALSVAGLLALARDLANHPPQRPFLLIASDSHSQDQAGMRETIWAISARSRDLRRLDRRLRADRREKQAFLDVLTRYQEGNLQPGDGSILQNALNHTIKLKIDRLSTRLMRLRMQEASGAVDARIRKLAARRMLLRRLSWRNEFSDLKVREKEALRPLVREAFARHRAVLKEIREKRRRLKGARRFRAMMVDYEPRALVSLHLSSHGDGLGAFNRGFLYYPLRSIINRTSGYRDLHAALRQAAADAPAGSPPFVSTLRPDRLNPWQDLLPDRPRLGGEVSALAGLPGLTLATTDDLRQAWGTPFDTPDRINWPGALAQWRLAAHLVHGLDRAASLETGYIRNGFSTVSGRATLLLHGELFAEHPAPGTTLLAFQGPARYHLITDLEGKFLIKGVADKKHLQDKVILEGYRFSTTDGSVIWAIDKKQTGKPAYRVKMRRRSMSTDLVMFNCRQTTIFNLLEPRSLRYMTKLQLLDGRREAPPVRYWYSRIDTRSSIIASIFLEPGTRLKLTLSDTVLQKKMILTNGSAKDPMGSGYLVDTHPSLYHTAYLAARDMWALLLPRIRNLEEHGIHDGRIKKLQEEGVAALARAGKALAAYRYTTFTEESSRAWALASRVYDRVESTQKDVLFGVLFYIALFVPFAFCMERLLFGFVSIYKRIVAFSAILLALILLIARVHPAFELAYSPTVVILAFFIIGLSFLVTMIIILRFEDEMTLLQRRASHKRPEEISAWKAFAAAFFLGVSNLRRRRLRTALTCLTLIILTFTIMSFTTVKTLRRQNRLRFEPRATYQGLLLKNIDWHKLPEESLAIFESLFDGNVVVAPRVWLAGDKPSRAGRIMVRHRGRGYRFQGLTGLSPDEPRVSGLDRILVRGRWFRRNEPNAVLIPSGLAERLGIDPEKPGQATLDLWGMSLKVTGVFSEKRLQRRPDLDGEILTPAIFPPENTMEMREVEKEALESGEDVRTFQGRYHHIPPDQVLILPATTLLKLGGTLRGVALHPPVAPDPALARKLTDRFSLALFSGERDGVYLYNATDTMSYSGMPNIMIPMLISILIVLNTMISSVFERKNEIAVYTSVGLAPSHVSFLFIAEALAFAILSVVLGYLLAQTSAGLLAGTSLWQGITVNYSSTAGVAAMVLVMGVVLLSVIYPSRVAARIAIPDVNRSWSIPDAGTDTLRVTLPFLMRYHEHASICGFLHSYLLGHRDISHGLFSTSNVELLDTTAAARAVAGALAMARGCLHLRCKVWLAPFDFGIMQWVDVSFCPAREGEDFMEITITLTRVAGEVTLWRRVNRSFLHALRKQLLIWRSLDEEGHREYAALLHRNEQELEKRQG
ncbi:MAG TPA: FtsX-like permease family protein [Desulfobulbus sp.]|nr:FtsX-like permease family protein [Desulfobulbus sp.]